MIQTFASMLPTWQRAVTIVFGLGAAAGWGMFAVSGHSAAETERQLREQVATLQTGQLRLLSERDQLQSAATEVAQLRKQLSLAQDETARLTQERVQVQPKWPPARSSPRTNSPAVRPPQNGVSQTGSITSMPPTPPQAPARAARTALTKPGPGLLVAASGSGDGKR
jgi:TolA-binding protein